MDEAYEVNSKTVEKSALPKHNHRLEIMSNSRMAMFDQLVDSLDAYIQECLCSFYKNATDSIQQIVSDCADSDSDGNDIACISSLGLTYLLPPPLQMTAFALYSSREGVQIGNLSSTRCWGVSSTRFFPLALTHWPR